MSDNFKETNKGLKTAFIERKSYQVIFLTVTK